MKTGPQGAKVPGYRAAGMNKLAPLLALFCLQAPAIADPALRLDVQPQPLFRDLPRIGLNLGDWTPWGASQFMRNVLKNPGFEGTLDRTLVVVGQSDPLSFSDDVTWTGRPDGFWTGARYSVRTGRAAGMAGTLIDSRHKGRHDLPSFVTRDPAPPLAPGDAVALTRIDDTEPSGYWQTPRDALPGQVRLLSGQRRSDGLGNRVLVLEAVGDRPGRSTAYLDAISGRSGKLLPIDGRWRVSIWARPESPSATLVLKLQRPPAQPFLNLSIPLKPGWQKVEREFDAKDNGPPGTVEFRLEVPEGTVTLDDASLGPVTADDFPFRPELLAVLERLKPGYLRDWEGQLGDSFENRIADPYARRSVRYRPGPDAAYYLYGLGEFLDLCKKVGANPWVVLPTTADDEEYVALGRWLAERQRRDGFAEIVVEFGNENWNAIFRPAGLQKPATLGAAASRAFAGVAQGAGPGMPLKFAVGGQHVNPDFALQALDATPRADLLVVAPYLLHELNRKDFQAEPWPLLFRPDRDLPKSVAGVRKRGKGLAVYEVNLHTTRGDVPLDLRNDIVAGTAAGAALGQRLLEALALGVSRQCVYTLAQYDTGLPNNGGFAKLWGVARDLGATRRLRPTGLAMMLLNGLLPGDVHAVEIQGDADGVTALGFRGAKGFGLAVVSGAARPRAVAVKFPATAAPPRRLRILDGTRPEANNEDAEGVRIVERALGGGPSLRFTLPPWSLVVLEP